MEILENGVGIGELGIGPGRPPPPSLGQGREHDALRPRRLRRVDVLHGRRLADLATVAAVLAVPEAGRGADAEPPINIISLPTVPKNAALFILTWLCLATR